MASTAILRVKFVSRPMAAGLLAMMMLVAPASAEDADTTDESDADSSSKQGQGNTTDESRQADKEGSSGQHDGGAVHSETTAKAPCGIVYWHQNDPDRVIVDPDNCFTPMIYELIGRF